MSQPFVLNIGMCESRSITLGATHALTVPPLASEQARVGKCYRNVMAAISTRGGQAVYGWAVTDFGPHRISGSKTPAPLYRRWLNHVVWRDLQGKLWEVSPNAVIDDHSSPEFLPTEFIIDATATFEIISDDEWFTRPSRYLPVRPEGVTVTDYLTKAQLTTDTGERNRCLGESLNALAAAGFRPREWKVEMVGERTGSIWLIAE
ncbi:MAG TPA: hypothetical protein VGI40_04450 [Pirellulaceae bacterium]|jgi:hypothetical protein